MSNAEYRITQFFKTNRTVFLYIIISIIALVIRYSGINFISGDMKGFLLPWYDTISNYGSDALKHQVGDYGLLYQTIIYLLVKFPFFSADTKYKLLSILFDFILALCSSYIVCIENNTRLNSYVGVITYTFVILCPTVIFNSSYWGQCDSIFTCFCLITIIFIMKKKYKSAFIFYGIALAFKLQAIFLLPFILCYYIYTNYFSIFNLFLSLLAFWFSGIIAYLKGRSIWAPFTIYIHQTHEYSNQMAINIASFWNIIGQNSDFLKSYAILLTVALLGLGLYHILSIDNYFNSTEQILYFSAWTIWTCILFLPQMHERYTYLLDIILIVLALSYKKYIAYAFISVLLSTITYAHYLFESPGVTRISSIIYLTGWLTFSLIHCLFTYEDISKN